MNLHTALTNYIKNNNPKKCGELIDFFPIELRVKLKPQKVKWFSITMLIPELESQVKGNDTYKDGITMYNLLFYSFDFTSTKEGHQYWYQKSWEYFRNSEYVFNNESLEIKYLI